MSEAVVAYTESRFACRCGRFLAESAIHYTTFRDDSRYYGIRDEVEWDCSRCGTVKGEEWEPQIVPIREVTYYAPTDQPEEVRCGGEEVSDG